MENNSVESKAIELRRAYYKKWRAENRDKVKTYNRNRWLKKAAALAASEQAAETSNDGKDNK